MWSAVVAATCLLSYAAFVRPWHRHWGAPRPRSKRSSRGTTRPGASATTRAVTIGAPPEDVWPWLLQIGFGRAGWYSYDWLDNDGLPERATCSPDLQDSSPAPAS